MMLISNPRIIFLGASGAVGTEALNVLLQTNATIDLLLRRNLPGATAAHEHIVDVLDPATYRHHITGHDVAICTFGVGQPTKVSQEEFTRVDKQAVLDFAKACKDAGVRHFTLLGSTMADAKSKSSYLRSKGELRDAIAAMGFERFSVFQPSMILTQENRYGFSQAAMLAVWPLLSPFLIGALKKYRGIRVEELGRAIAHNLRRDASGLELFHWTEIKALAEKRPIA
jgi:uncharacterized protein YbjT (DUF2867 family)